VCVCVCARVRVCVCVCGGVCECVSVYSTNQRQQEGDPEHRTSIERVHNVTLFVWSKEIMQLTFSKCSHEYETKKLNIN
jgi:hypothetical protein